MFKVGAAFPTVVRRGEVELHRAGRFDLRVAVELRSVVGGDRLELSGVAAHQGQRRFARLLYGARSQFTTRARATTHRHRR